MYNYGVGKTFFELSKDCQPYDRILFVKKGSFSMTFSDSAPIVFCPYEVSYVPANVKFTREVLSPIDFYQYIFTVPKEDLPYSLLKAGKLNVPPDEVKSIIRALDTVSAFPSDNVFSRHYLQRLIMSNYIYTRSSEDGKLTLSSEIQDTIDYINGHLNERLEVDKLAKRVFLSYSGLNWKFKQELSVSPSTYIINARMELAKTLLKDVSTPIAVIAERCGYQNAYYFSNAFRKEVGISPTNFRHIYIEQYHTYTVVFIKFAKTV